MRLVQRAHDGLERVPHIRGDIHHVQPDAVARRQLSRQLRLVRRGRAGAEVARGERLWYGVRSLGGEGHARDDRR